MNATAQMVMHEKVVPRRATKKLSSDKIIEIVKREIDDCKHPECVADRKRKGYSNCAGGHIARRVVQAIKKAARQ